MPRGTIIRTAAGLVLILVLGIGGFMRAATIEHPVLWGPTMGTSYSVKISGKIKRTELQRLSKEIDEALLEVNRQMSTWDPESEISRFNQAEAGKPFSVSEPFATVVATALELSESTKGAFDPTLQPLLNLWGFGSSGKSRSVPSDEAIAATKATTGWQQLAVTNNTLSKTIPELALDLGAIAKGYGVDAIGKLLAQAGLENWFVEIGGEVLVSGINPQDVPWRIGIQYPTTNPMDERLQGIVHLSGGAVATSGDYRNYIVEDGVVYSHILDPRTGRAVRSGTAGVTVTAPSCMEADGIATALFVMGPEEGMAWIEHRPDVECMFLLHGENGQITERFSSGFARAAGYTPSQ